MRWATLHQAVCKRSKWLPCYSKNETPTAIDLLEWTRRRFGLKAILVRLDPAKLDRSSSAVHCIVDEEGGQFWLERTQRNPFVASVGIDLVDKVRGYFQPKPIVWINFALDLETAVLAVEDGAILEFD
jgi:hypothetical protein